MKLRDFSSRRGDGGGAGKRRKRQLLIEPPPLPPPVDATGSGEGERKYHNLADSAELESCCHMTATTTTTTTARDKNTTSDRCHQDHHYQTDTMRHYESDQSSRLPTMTTKNRKHQDGQCGHSTATSVIARNSNNDNDNRWRRGAPLDDIGQNQHYNSHGRYARRPHQQDQQQVASNTTTTTTTTKRKSELTSFLTILFGSLLAALLLVGHQHNHLTLCSSDMRPSVGTSDSQSSPLVHQNATLLLKVPITISSSSSSSNSTATAQPKLANGTLQAGPDPRLAPPSKAASADEEEELADGEDLSPAGESTEEGDESPHKTRLGGLLSESASDGTDTLLGHLQPSVAAGNSNVASDETAPEEKEEGELGAGDEGAGPGESGGGESAAKKPAEVPRASPLKSQQQNSTDEFPPWMTDEPTRAAMGVYAKWRHAADDLIELFSRKLMPVVMEHGYDVDAGTVTGLLQVFNGIRQLRPWAVKLLDASFKLAPGILVGTQSDFGDFDECLNIRVDDPSGLAGGGSGAASASPDDDTYFPSSQLDPLTGLKSTTIVGRYCLADVEFPKPPRRRRPTTQTGGYTPNTTGASQLDQFEPIELRKSLLDFSQLPAYKDTIFVETGNFLHMLYVDPIRVGVCLTNKIDPESMQQVVNKLLEEFKITINFHGRCATKYDRPTWTVYQRTSAYVLLVACSLVLVSTLLDLLHAKLNKLPCPRAWHESRLRLQLAASKHRPLFTSFSLIRNTKRLFRKPQLTEQPPVGVHKPPVLASNGLGYAASLAATTTASSQAAGSTSASSLADSSVESSPTIERRSSAATTVDTSNSSMNDLIPQQRREFTNFQPEHFASDHKLFQRGTGSEQQQRQAANLTSLHGIRVLTMTWMIVNHTYMFGGFFVLWAHRRLIDIAEWPKSLSFQLVLNGWLTVETYFFLSALIIVLTVMPLMKARKFNYFVYIFHRLLRLLPAYVGLVCLNFLWPLISAGPVWLVKGKSFVQTPCEQYLWTNFLFINNWIWPEKQCMVHTWFLSADFQLYLLAPIIVYLLYRRPALGHSLNLLVAICASVLSGFVIYANELLPTTLINKLEFDAIKQQLSYSYFATYQHMGPYCLGILTGYLLHKRPHARLPKHLTWLLWLLLPPLSFTTLLLTYLWNGAYDDPSLINPSPLVSAFYVAIHRTIWTALVAWLVFACTTGRAKLLANFLSHSLFLPISRLSYSIYLVHLPVIMFRSLNLRHTLEWTDQNILWEACGNFVVSIFMGYFLNVAFESPIINLENVLMRRNRRNTCHAGDAQLSEKHPHHQATIFQTSKHLGLAINGKQVQNHDQQQVNDTQAGFGYSTTASSSAASDSASDGCPRDESATTTQNNNANSHGEPPRVNSRSSSLARGSIVNPESAIVQGLRRKSLRPKQTSSVEQIFGNHDEEHQQQAGDVMTTASSSLTSSTTSSNVMGEERQQVAMNKERLFADAEKSFGARQSRGRSAASIQHTAGGAGDSDQEDTVYSMTNEYRHYAPAGYQQWRRAMNHSQQQHRPSMPMGRSGRPQQYATLARSSRLCRDPSMSMIADDFHRPQHSNFRYGGNPHNSARLIAQREMHMNYGAHDHDQQLFPNTSELGGVSSGDYHLMDPSLDLDSRQMDQLHRLQAEVSSATRRPNRTARPGRYNTLTGTGTGTGRSDWRSQLVASREPDLMSSWDAPAAWLANSNAPNSSGGGGGGSLLIPRIDSSTLRRHSQRAIVGQHREQQQHESMDSKIVEEPTAEENSAL